MSEIKDTRSIADGAVADEDILLDNNDWLRSKNQAASGNINLLKADTSDRLHLGDAATGLPIVIGAQLASDPAAVTAGFYYNTTDNLFKFYNGTGWASVGDGANKTLSNLDATTAIDQNLNFLFGSAKTLVLDNQTYLQGRKADNLSNLNMWKVDNFNRMMSGTHVIPDANGTWDNGLNGLAWRNSFAGIFNINLSGVSIGTLNGVTTSPSGVTSSTITTLISTGRHLGLFTPNDATANTQATKDVRIESGNKTAGTGDSGSLYLQTGTSTGGARGSILLNETSLGAASNGFVWTLQDNATGRGSWVAAPALGANTTLSNLDATTTINQNLNFVYGSGKSVHLDKDVYITGRNSTDTGDIDLIKVDAFNRTTIASGVGQTIQLVNSMWPFSNNSFSLGGSVAWSNVQSFAFTLSSGAGAGKLDIVATTPSGVANTLGLRSLNNAAVSVFTGNSAIADALGTGSLLIETGNKSNAAATAGTGSIFYKTGDSAATASGGSGGFNFTIGTTVSGTQGDFQFLKSGVANTIGDVWTATSTDGKGYWAAAGGGVSYPLLAPAGTAGAPSYSFSGDTNTGLFALAPDVISLATGGVNRVALSTTDMNIADVTLWLLGSSTMKIVNGSFNTEIRANPSIAGNTVFQTPIDNGTNGFVLQTDGTGITSWVAGGANATLSNLTSPTAVNQDLLLDATKTIRLPNDTYLKIRNAADSADQNILKLDAFDRVFLGGGQWMPDANETWDFGVAGLAWRNINSSLYNIYKSGSSIGQINGTDASPSGLITANTGMMLRTFSPRHLGIFTDSSAAADAVATKDVRIESGNKTAGTGDSGSLYLQTGTSTGGARGGIICSARYLLLPTAASAPSAPAAGWMYYDSTTNKSYTYDGTTWQAHW